MASRGEFAGPSKRQREPSTPNSQRRSKRHYGSDSSEVGSECLSTTPGQESAVNIAELTASVRSLGIADTPKSSRKSRGVREKLKGRSCSKNLSRRAQESYRIGQAKSSGR